MTTLSHSNTWLHRMLTDQGAFVHEHSPESFEDIGDAENGPQLSGGPAFDRYSGESHEMIIDHTGLVVACYAIDWDEYRWIENMISENGTEEEWPEGEEYHYTRRAGENWQVYFMDEDGTWWAQSGSCWTSDPDEAHYFIRSQAEQLALAHDLRGARGERLVGKARIIERKSA